MNHRVQNVLWWIQGSFESERNGNIVGELLNAAGRDLPVASFREIDCTYRTRRKMIDASHLRTLFIIRSDVMDLLESLMIEIYRDYERSRGPQTILFYPEDHLDPITVIGRGSGYVFASIVKEQCPDKSKRLSKPIR
jgi:hypothetical protein